MQRSYSTLLSAETGLPIATPQEGREPSAKHQALSAAQRIHDSRRPKAAATAEIVQPVFQRSYSALCADEAGVPIELMQEVLATEGRDESVKPRVLSAAQRIWSSRVDTPPLAQEWAVTSQTRKNLRQQGSEVLAVLGSSSSDLQRTPPRAPVGSSTGGKRKEVRYTGDHISSPSGRYHQRLPSGRPQMSSQSEGSRSEGWSGSASSGSADNALHNTCSFPATMRPSANSLDLDIDAIDNEHQPGATPISGWTPTSKDNKEKRVTIKAEEWTIEDFEGLADRAMWVDEPGASCGWTRVVYEANPYDGTEM